VLGAGVEIFKVVFNTFDELGEIIDDLVGAVLALVAELVITKDDSLTVHDHLFRDLEIALTLSEHEILEHFLVIFVDHTIGEDTHVLVIPELDEFEFSVDRLLVSTARALEDLRDISQVERVVGLVGRGLQLTLHTRVDHFGGLNKLGDVLLNFLLERSEETVENLDEDHRD